MAHSQTKEAHLVSHLPGLGGGLGEGDFEEEYCIAEATLFEKYKNIVFDDPDMQAIFHITGMEFDTRRNGVWHLVGETRRTIWMTSRLTSASRSN